MSKKSKMTLCLVFGLAIYSTLTIVANLYETSRFLTAICSIFRYSGLLAFIFGVNYFGTTYIWERNPELSRDELIHTKDERNRSIEYKTKTSVFNIMFYVLLIMVVLFIDLKIEFLASGLLIATLVIMGICYAYFKHKYTKEM